MATGTTLHFLSYTNDIISEKLLAKYIEQVKNYNNSLIGNDQKDSCIFPPYFSFNNDEKNVVIVNDNPGKIIPTVNSLHIAEDFSTDFNSLYTILSEKWDMNAFYPLKSQHVLTDLEISQLLPVCEYITSDLVHHKDAKKFEKIMFSENMFLNDFLENLPSRKYAKEFSSDNYELQEMEDCVFYFCKQFAIFIHFYLSISSNYEEIYSDKKKYCSLIYTKW